MPTWRGVEIWLYGPAQCAGAGQRPGDRGPGRGRGFARILLAQFGVVIGSHLLQIGAAASGENQIRALSEEEQEKVEESPVRCLTHRRLRR